MEYWPLKNVESPPHLLIIYLQQQIPLACCVYSITKENAVDKEDLAGRNIFFVVALGLCAAIAPAC